MKFVTKGLKADKARFAKKKISADFCKNWLKIIAFEKFVQGVKKNDKILSLDIFDTSSRRLSLDLSFGCEVYFLWGSSTGTLFSCICTWLALIDIQNMRFLVTYFFGIFGIFQRQMT